jgi:hypothetical protein
VAEIVSTLSAEARRGTCGRFRAVIRAQRGRWLVGAVAVLAVAGLGAAFAGAQSGEPRSGTDPLSPTEQQEAIAAAGFAGETGADDESTGGDSATDDSTGGDGGESGGAGETIGTDDVVVLLVERHEEGKGPGADDLRRADVYTYDYGTDTLTISVVDLATFEVDNSQTVTGTQLPLIEAETDLALELALADDEVAELLGDEYAEATGATLTDPVNQLIIQPIVFLASSNPNAATGAAAGCGDQRCAQLLIRTTDHLLIDLLPIIDLSSQRVVSDDGGRS